MLFRYLFIKVKLNKKNLDILKIWWNIAFKEGDTEQYNKCEKLCDNIIKIGKHRCKKLLRWYAARMNDLLYIPEHYKDENGILDKYYTKDNIVEICNDNKVVACHVYTKAFGEFIEDKFKELITLFNLSNKVLSTKLLKNSISSAMLV